MADLAILAMCVTVCHMLIVPVASAVIAIYLTIIYTCYSYMYLTGWYIIVT